MADLLVAFQSWPLDVRAVLLIAVIWLAWSIFGRIFIRITAIAPLALRTVLRGLYRLMDFPLGTLHKMFAGIFIGIDWGWTEFNHSIDNRVTKVFRFFCKTKSCFRIQALVLCVILCALIVLPGLFGLDNFMREPERIYSRAERWVIERLQF